MEGPHQLCHFKDYWDQEKDSHFCQARFTSIINNNCNGDKKIIQIANMNDQRHQLHLDPDIQVDVGLVK